jgi:hypothetical protein
LRNKQPLTLQVLKARQYIRYFFNGKHLQYKLVRPLCRTCQFSVLSTTAKYCDSSLCRAFSTASTLDNTASKHVVFISYLSCLIDFSNFGGPVIHPTKELMLDLGRRPYFPGFPQILGCHVGCTSKFVAVVTGFPANARCPGGTTRSPVVGCPAAGASPR